MRVIPYWPLASGLLTGKYRRDAEPIAGSRMALYPAAASRMLTEANFDALETLTGIARDAGCTMLDLAIGWLLSLPSVGVVIAGATRPGQVRANARAAERAPSLDRRVLEAAERAIAR